MNGRQWSTGDDRRMRQHYPYKPAKWLARHLRRTLRAVYERATVLGLRKSHAFLSSTASGRLRDGSLGAASRFKPGQQPHNAGVKGWQAGGRSPATRYKPGNVSGRAAQLLQPIGALRINADGYLDRKVRADGPPQSRWVGVHRLVWIAAHGPVPASHAVVFLPGRRTTDVDRITLDGLELITRADLMKRNTRHNLPPELNTLIQLRAALNRKINNREVRA